MEGCLGYGKSEKYFREDCALGTFRTSSKIRRVLFGLIFLPIYSSMPIISRSVFKSEEKVLS